MQKDTPRDIVSPLPLPKPEPDEPNLMTEVVGNGYPETRSMFWRDVTKDVTFYHHHTPPPHPYYHYRRGLPTPVYFSLSETFLGSCHGSWDIRTPFTIDVSNGGSGSRTVVEGRRESLSLRSSVKQR